MIFDKLLQVSSQQALTASARSTDVINLGHSQLIGPGCDLYWVIAVRVGLAGTTPTFSVKQQYDDNANFSSASDGLSSPQYSSLAAGSLIVLPMSWNNEQFMSLYYTLGGTTPTITVDAYVTPCDPALWKAFPDGVIP